MARRKGYKPSYYKSIKGWLVSKFGTCKVAGLKHPIRTTRTVKRYLQGRALKKYGAGVMGYRAHGYEKARKYLKPKRK